MADTFKEFGQAAPADTSNATLYTVPASTTSILKSVRVCNVTSSDATYRLFIVPSSDSAAADTAISYDRTVIANESFNDTGDIVMETGATVVVRSGTADALTFTASGLEIT